jgi:hypothetical protein
MMAQLHLFELALQRGIQILGEERETTDDGNNTGFR